MMMSFTFFSSVGMSASALMLSVYSRMNCGMSRFSPGAHQRRALLKTESHAGYLKANTVHVHAGGDVERFAVGVAEREVRRAHLLHGRVPYSPQGSRHE